MSLPLPPLQRISTRDGEMLIPRFDRYVGLSLDVYGEYSPDEREALCAMLSPGDTVVQVGANVGALTIPLARAVGPTGVVAAFEPQDLMFRALMTNAVLTNQLHVLPMRFAVGAKDGTACLPIVDYTSPGNFGGVSLSTEQTEQTVPLTRLDSCTGGMNNLRLLHIDAEGAEIDVLAGAEELIRRTRPIIVVEIDRPAVREAMPAWLQAHGYVGAEHRPPMYSAGNFRGVEKNVFMDASGVNIVSINLICVPEEQTLTFKWPEAHLHTFDGKPILQREAA